MTSTERLFAIARDAHIFKIMGESKVRSVTLDIIQPVAMTIVPRLDEDDDSLTAPPPRIETLRFHLEDQMFGCTTFVALTCEGKVVIGPFRWESWEHLAKHNINITVS